MTASSFGSIVKRRSSFAPLVSRLLYGKRCLTVAMKYGHDNEAVAQEACIAKQRDEHQRTVFVTKTGLHIDCLVRNHNNTYIQSYRLSFTLICRTIG